MAIWMDGRIGSESAWIERRVWGLIIIIQSEPPTPPPTHRNGNRKIIIITRTTNRDRGKTKQNQTEQNEFLEFLKSHKTTTSFDLIFEIQSTGIEHMYGYVKNTFQFTLSPADRVPLKKTPQTNHPKMRGCCGRESRTYVYSGHRTRQRQQLVIGNIRFGVLGPQRKKIPD